MLAAAVDPLKGLFMQKTGKTMAVSSFFHQLHDKLVVVDRNIYGFKNRCKLVLCGSHLVMLGFGRDPKLPELLIQFFHKCFHTRLDGTEIVVIHFLSLRSRSAKQCPSTEYKILSFTPCLFIYKKIFLLGAYGCKDTLHVRFS